ncbi:MAG TPA: sigma-70 family RNA polymerase sigma factor [Kofleriaceae bacterium]
MATGVADIESWLALARAQFPDIVLEPAKFEHHLQRHGIALAGEPEHAADLYLACACAAGDPRAFAAFDRELIPVVTNAAQKIERSPHFVDEITQLTRERLLIASDGAEPRIADYAGQGPLRAWVRIAAMRIAMNQLRDRKKDMLVDDEAFFDVVADGSDDERREARARYGQACSDALRAAFAKLTARERNLLRMHHLHGLTVDELAPMFRVHRATIARWISSAREHLLTETRNNLRDRLAIGEGTVDSILRELAGQIEISVSRLLAE